MRRALAVSQRQRIIAGLLLGGYAAALSAGGIAGLSGQVVARIRALEPEIEALVSATKPADWPARHACLYYALAGQYLLAQQGITAELVTGRVLYDPDTIHRHAICPHAWLETGAYLIDFATLPRDGEITVIPQQGVAHRAREIRPGSTRVLAIRRPRDPDHLRYLARHRARFEHILRQCRAE